MALFDKVKFITTSVPVGNCIATSVQGSEWEFILNYPGHELDRHNNIVDVRGWAPNDKRWGEMGIKVPSYSDLALRKLGLYAVGFPPRSVAEWMQQWAELEYKMNSDGTVASKRTRRVRREKTRLFKVAGFAYAFRMEGVETSMGFKVDIDFTVTVQGTNPETAIVRKDNWYLIFEPAAEARARNYVGGKDFFQLLRESSGKALRDLFNPLSILKEQLEEEARSKGKPLPAADPDLRSFQEYVAQTTVEIEKDPANGDYTLIPVELPQGLGIRITNAVITDISISASEAELLKLISIVSQQQLKSSAELVAAKTERQVRKERAEGMAAAMREETGSRADRFDRADRLYLEKEGGVRLVEIEAAQATAVRVAELQTEAMKSVATAVENREGLETVVFPNTGVAPVVPIGGNKAT